jgi:hypothetical protein
VVGFAGSTRELPNAASVGTEKRKKRREEKRREEERKTPFSLTLFLFRSRIHSERVPR